MLKKKKQNKTNESHSHIRNEKELLTGKSKKPQLERKRKKEQKEGKSLAGCWREEDAMRKEEDSAEITG